MATIPHLFHENTITTLRRRRLEHEHPEWELESHHDEETSTWATPVEDETIGPAIPVAPSAFSEFHEAREDLDTEDTSDIFLETPMQSTAESKMRSSAALTRRYRDKVGAFVTSVPFQNFIVLLICVNAIMMGIATFDYVVENPRLNRAFETTDEVFLIIFTVELVLQFIYRGMALFTDGWLVFDFSIIVMSWMFASVQVIRAFRIFRALRLISRVKVMREIVTALISVIPRMCAIGVLLLLVKYIFSVMFTTLFRDTYPEYTSENYFGNLELSAFTLYQLMTLDNWSDICREVQQKYPWAWAPFIVYIIISAFVVFNLIIAVVCDAIADLHSDEVHEKKKEEGILPLSQQIEVMEEMVASLGRQQERTRNMIEYIARQVKVS
eukprot:CAMPEP_0172488904 /NCGR_PEP_ID=MMETSP1066-20121228/18618_1 /TAXON_ID=671091 /ORGANISM="Coscinodiscus wailesii, Strain CCMP2513" /LENGTH=382 /DNA_ID=CAMNT_0013256405 /DNA_START=118 /DNA_END=1266 /DNA_ORIENTATION=-